MFAGFGTTVTIWLAVATFPLTSVTVQTTVVVPTGKVAGALFVVEATPQLSAVDAEPSVAEAVQVFNAAVTVTAAGATTVGN